MNRFFKFAMGLVMVAGFSLSSNAQILYKVEKAGNDKVSYLLGTHHFAPLSVVDSIAELPAIMKSVDKVYGELDMSQMKDPAVMMGLQSYLMAPADSTLDKVIAPADFEIVRKVWDEYTGGAAPLDMMTMVKPNVISTQLSALMAQKVLPQLNPLEGIDMTMQDRARELGKPVEGLETMAYQMDMLYNIPVAEQAADLVEIVKNVSKEEEKAIKLSQAYLNHDIDQILETMVTMEDEDPGMAERMIYGRNENWVNRFVKEMPEESLLVVVGAGHLPGERGVIAGLKKDGYTVTPVK